MLKALYVGLGGFLGSAVRYWVDGWISTRFRGDFPLATFLINLTGSLFLGFFMALATERVALDPRWRLFIAVGFVGAYTTFSTFEYETERLASAGGHLLAWANVVLSVAGGFLAVWIGGRIAVKL